jgi:hypothetical protein
MREPLIHIGYHKTGSTWLQDEIFADPSYGFVQADPRMLADEAFISVNPFAFDASQAAELFRPLFADAGERDLVPVVSHERLSGDPNSGGVDSRDIADRLNETFPNGRVLIVIREQREMLLSVYKSQVRFTTYTIAERWRDRTIRERRTPGPTLDYFAYHYLVAYYQKLFGAERVLVLPYELLRRDAVGFVARIARFVDVAPPTDVPNASVNVSLPAGLLHLNRYVNIVLRASGLSERFQGPIQERRLMRGHLKVLRKLAPLTPKAFSERVERRWRETIAELIHGRYAESNRLTAEATGLDLASFGYDVAN